MAKWAQKLPATPSSPSASAGIEPYSQRAKQRGVELRGIFRPCDWGETDGTVRASEPGKEPGFYLWAEDASYAAAELGKAADARRLPQWSPMLTATVRRPARGL